MLPLLTSTDTVISIHENPFPKANDLSPEEKESIPREIESIRHNLVNVFRQLSKAKEENQTQNPIMTVHIRPGLHSESQSEMHVADADGASLLFYYLFDDWYTSYSLVARSEHQYSAHLERVVRYGHPSLEVPTNFYQEGEYV